MSWTNRRTDAPSPDFGLSQSMEGSLSACIDCDSHRLYYIWHGDQVKTAAIWEQDPGVPARLRELGQGVQAELGSFVLDKRLPVMPQEMRLYLTPI
ncbi:hypothetical protein Y1Q_0000994 [Alligator mississippiensis]|uniref:Uncharacterized protein n=1 Tax=Alligator mississippiensis TaxID=8496 RepID=A0A151NE62_ALLMI|nr:hypothetical protein Y1Q_0000994 [Alligator mississippiensis]